MRILLFLIFAASFVPGVFAQDRVALVIGNSQYEHVSALDNPRNDAEDIAAALTRIGFEVTLVRDMDANSMRLALHEFSDVSARAEMALVYYAGHGIEIDQRNYLIPVDAKLATDRDVTFEAIPLEHVTEAVAGATKLRIVLLDACRNNPFAGQMTLSNPTRSIGRGLVAPEVSGGTLVAYAAKGGTVASDGTGRNSPYAKALLTYMEEPGIEIDFLFRKVRDAVLAETRSQQEPFVYGSLPGEHLYLVPPVVAVTTTPTPTPSRQNASTSSQEAFAWRLANQSDDPLVVQDFIYAFPRGVHLEAALEKLRALTSPNLDAAPPVVLQGAEPSAERVVPQEPNDDAKEAIIVAIQEGLTAANCAPGPADGVWGPRSRAAWAEFAAAADLTDSSSEPTQGMLRVIGDRADVTCPEVAAFPQVAAVTPKAATAVGRPASLDGTWVYRSQCDKGDYGGSIAIAGSGGNFRSTTASVSGRVAYANLNGTAVSLRLEYQAFGLQQDDWIGTLSNGGRTITGTSQDSWGDRCSFTAMRQ